MGSADKRKSERLEGRFKVIVREKLATWVTTTEDVSARGCRIEARRPLTPGALVQLVFETGDGTDPLVAHAQIVWARRTAPLSAGIAFLSLPRRANEPAGKPGEWIDRLLAAYVRRLQERPAATTVAKPPGAARAPGVIVPPAP